MQVIRGIKPTYYGWVLIWTLAFTEMTSWGILYYTFSVLIAPMQATTGWDRADLSGAFSLARLIAGLAAIPIGRLLDRFGPRALMTVGSGAAVLLIVAWSQVQTVAALYVTWFGIGIVMAMVLYEPAFAVAAVWFYRKRAQALTILTFGGGLASVIYVPLTGALVRDHGWRGALLILAVFLCVLTLPAHAWLLRRSPAAMNQFPDGSLIAPPRPAHHIATLRMRTLLLTPKFWWLTLAFVLAGFSSSAIIFHLIPYLTDNGYSPVFAANVVGLVGVTALPGRLIFTPMAAHVSRKWIAAGLFALLTLSFPILLLAGTETGIVIFVLVFGIGYGAIAPARAGLTADLFGIERYGAVSGVMAFIVSVATAAAPLLISLSYADSKSYTPSLIGLLICSALAVVFTLRL